MRRHRRIVPAQELIEQAKNRRPRMPHIGQNYWYIVTKQNGRAVLLGSYDSQQEAEEIAVSKLNTDYEVVAMSTRDRAEATRRLRHKMLQGNGGNLETSLQRMKHTI